MARKEKKYHFIYKTINILSKRYYYGMHSTNNLDDGYLGSGKRLRYSINKYGKENHQREIIEFCNDRKSLKEREKEIVNLNEISKKDCMNLMVGGEGGFISDEYQKHRSVCANKKLHEKRKNDVEFDCLWKESIRKKTNERILNGTHKNWSDNYSWVGKKHSNETKQKMSESHKGKGTGKKNSQYDTCWITKDNINKKIKKSEINNYINTEWMLGRYCNLK